MQQCLSASVLIEQIGALLQEREELERQIEQALDDRDTAERVVDVLVAENDALRAALAAGHPSHRKKLLALAAAGALPMLTFIGAHTAAVVRGEYDLKVAEVTTESQEQISDEQQRSALRVARIAADAQIRAAQIAAEQPAP